jgi:hypothetical protein
LTRAGLGIGDFFPLQNARLTDRVHDDCVHALSWRKTSAG